MRCEWPELRRCCLCLPLRFGLIGTAWIKLVLDALVAVYLVCVVKYSRRVPLFSLVVMVVAALVVVVDVGFNCLLLRGCHRKDVVLLRLFYRYSLFLLGLNVVFALVLIIMDIVLSTQSAFIFLITLHIFFAMLMFTLLSIILHLYISILVRSEVQKLEATTQFQFTNNINAACNMAIHPNGAENDHPSTDGKFTHTPTDGEFAHTPTDGEFAHTSTDGNMTHSSTDGKRTHPPTDGKMTHPSTGHDYALLSTGNEDGPNNV